MERFNIRLLSIGLVFLMLAACGGSADHQDLRDYVEETKRAPVGQLDPLPPFTPYKSFAYGANTLRSPFDPPVEQEIELLTGRKSGVKPDFDREKEYLEGFNLGALTMVGTLKRGEVLWVLIDDGAGGIHRVTVGNYVGKNHGKILAARAHQLELIEIVADGADGWVERPKVLQLVEKE